MSTYRLWICWQGLTWKAVVSDNTYSATYKFGTLMLVFDFLPAKQ